MSPMGWNDIPATDPAQGGSGLRVRQAGHGSRAQGTDPAQDRHPQEPRERPSRESWPPAAPPTRCCISWPPPATSASSSRIDDFDRISRKTPVLADLKPWGNYTAPEMYDGGRHGGGGQAPARGRPAPRGREDGHRAHHRRGGQGGHRAGGPAGDQAARPGAQGRGRHRDPARQPGPRRLRDQALRPEEVRASRPRAGLRARGGRVRGGQEGQDQAQRRDRDPLRRAQGRPGHARDAARDRRAAGRRARARAWP